MMKLNIRMATMQMFQVLEHRLIKMNLWHEVAPDPYAVIIILLVATQSLWRGSLYLQENGWSVSDSIHQLDIGRQLDDRSYALDVIRIHINTTNNDAEQDNNLEAATSDDA